MKRSELFFTAVLIPVDLMSVVLAFLAAYNLRLNLGEVGFFWPIDQYLAFVGLLAPAWILIFTLVGLYSLKKNRRPWEEFASIFVGISGGTFAVVAWPFLTRQEFFSRLVVLYLFFFALAFVTLGRALVRISKEYLYRYGVGVHRVLVVGTNGTAYQFVREMRGNVGLGDRVVGLVKSRADVELHPEMAEYPVCGEVGEIEDILSRREIDDILIADPNLRRSQILQILEAAEDRGISCKICPSLLEVHSTRVGVSELAGVPLLEYKRTPLEGWGMILKRGADLLISSILIILTAPIMLFVALAIKFEGKGPVFFSRLDDGSPVLRIGQHGKPFHYVKFRSMVPGTHWQRYTKLKHLNTRQGPLVKLKDDPRITRVGKFVRKYSLDELPELFHVWTGKMSLVGPRPHYPEEVAKYEHRHRRVLILKPGMTGMGQISGRSDLDFEDEVRLDAYYIEHWSLWLDLQILLKTPFSVLGRRQKTAD